MADEGHVVGEFGRGRVEERGREQARESDQHDALPHSAERRSAQRAAAVRRRRHKEGEHAQEPDHERKDDMDDEALVEEPDRPQRRLIHAGNARQREQKRKDTRDRERADRKPCPIAQLARQRAD